MSNYKKIEGRRNFLKLVGSGAVAASAVFVGCKNNKTVNVTTLENVPKGEMSYRTTTSTGDKVSILGYGCMRWPLLPAPAADGNVIDQEAVNGLIDYALEHGVNYIDTAPVYVQGWSERSTGIALKRHPRDKYFIATKLSNFSPSTWSREESMKIYNNSFKYLQTDYIDYMLLHAVGQGGMESLNGRYIDNGMLDFLIQERTKGKIRNLGFSYHGDVKVFDYLLSLHPTIKWDFVQIQLNYVDWEHAKQVNPINTNASYLYAELEKRDIPVIIMEPLLGGRLAKLPDHLQAQLKAKEPNTSVASWAFRYAGSFPKVLTVLSGMTYMEHLQDNIKTYSPLKELDKSEFDLLYKTADLMIEYPLIQCTACQYCMPCPYGIDIPSIFNHYNKCVTEDNIPQDSQSPNYREARKAFLVGYDRSVPKLRQASHCIGCDQCVHHCPQAINIPKELRKIDRYTEKLKRGTI